MRPMLAVLVLVLALPMTLAWANDEKRVPFSELMNTGLKALAKGDEETARAIDLQMFGRLYGFRIKPSEWRDELPRAENEKRMCPHRREAASELTPERVHFLHHGTRMLADALVATNQEDRPFVAAILQCQQDNGEPVAEAEALRDGLAWAKKLAAADMETTRAMIGEYDLLTEQYPDEMVYRLLHGSIKSRIGKMKYEREREETKKRYPKGILFQGNLVNKAHGGDLSAQLELARRLETGDLFRQNNAMAYFWYKRALTNGGGGVAQSGMDRLHPHLSIGEFKSIEIWTRNNHRPY
ncbi:SEL1-like repeat protein [Magnetospira sp. QH-2]|uniref:SEL1-like repeat protein n=1 Tax=Magnetospira sp. (strain QH-2) TaxID=1288970 RepID=UPI0003E81A41|nr:SEL1-like repeat protein [Magnetospira sp. QH-2]CCQ74447.1 Hypothetical exported protein of unknown function [Magnetospira sp. QH-2]